MPILFVEGKNAPTLSSCQHRHFTKQCHLNVRGGLTVYTVGQDRVDQKSPGVGLGESQALSDSPSTCSFCVNVVPQTHREGLQRSHRGFVCHPYDARVYLEMILEVTFMAQMLLQYVNCTKAKNLTMISLLAWLGKLGVNSLCLRSQTQVFSLLVVCTYLSIYRYRNICTQISYTHHTHILCILCNIHVRSL